MTDPSGQSITLPVLWVGAEELPVLACNQMFITRDDNVGDFYLTFGNATTPPLVGDIAEAARQIGYVPIRGVSRLAVSPHRLREFHGVLAQIIRRLDEQERSER